MTLAMAAFAIAVLGSSAPAWAITMTTGVSCHKTADSSYPFGPHIHSQASGVQFPRNTQIDVLQQWFEDGTYFAQHSTRIYTTSTGSWSVPSEVRFAEYPKHNRFDMTVWVYQVSTDKLLAEQTRGCWMVPPALK
ncbi:MAG: hypothetical protein HOV67_00520 [Kribbellaceae bacterium]|nr:hypothetical protein [Catenulispora sp.]NUR93718.1 hypothetical protein [Kribbellaceae bacterium]